MAELDAFEARFAAAYRRYLDEVPTTVDAAAVARTVVGARPSVRARLWPWTLRPLPALAWLVLVGLVVASLVAAALLVGSRPESPITMNVPRHPAALVPTGVATLAPKGSAFGGAAADPSGAIWVSAGGTLGRLDPVSGAIRTWTHADDAAFGNIGFVVSAHGGGVWLVPQVESVDQALRWFDGERFLDVVPAPPSGIGSGWGGVSLAEAADGSLWSGDDSGLFRWDGTSWSDAPEGRPAAGVSAFAVDRSGAVWVGNCDFNAVPVACSGVSRYDGTRWETFTDMPTVIMIREAPDGSIWVSGREGTARYDGHVWTRPGGDLTDRFGAWGRVTWAADGTVWVTECAYFQGETLVSRYDGNAWVEYTAADGLPRSTNCGQVFATAHGVYVGTGDGLYRLVDDRWERVWP